MPRFQVIVLEQLDTRLYRYALWADVPAARQAFYAESSAKSAWSAATSQDLANLQSGAVIEKVDTIQIPAAWGLPEIKAELAARAASYQAAITAANPWVRYGTTFDGATWVNGGVA